MSGRPLNPDSPGRPRRGEPPDSPTNVAVLTDEGEVAAPVDRVVVEEVGVRALRPAARRLITLGGEHSDCHRDRDLAGLLRRRATRVSSTVFPVDASRGCPGVCEPVQRDVVQYLVFRRGPFCVVLVRPLGEASVHEHPRREADRGVRHAVAHVLRPRRQHREVRPASCFGGRGELVECRASNSSGAVRVPPCRPWRAPAVPRSSEPGSRNRVGARPPSRQGRADAAREVGLVLAGMCCP